MAAGQGFMPTSWKRAGNWARRAVRAMVMLPVSSGSRSASRAARWNWETRPGTARRCAPARSPPAGQCGRADQRHRTGAVVRTGGRHAQRSMAKRWASIDLPEPDGPTISRLCWRAAATSRVRLAPAWPLTSARSATAAAGPAGAGSAWCQPSSAASLCRAARQELPHHIEQVGRTVDLGAGHQGGLPRALGRQHQPRHGAPGHAAPAPSRVHHARAADALKARAPPRTRGRRAGLPRSARRPRGCPGRSAGGPSPPAGRPAPG